MGALEIIQERGLEAIGRYYGTYRAIVVDDIDPNDQNKIQVTIPNWRMGAYVWAYPKSQYGSVAQGFKLLPPKKGDTVFVDFICGDPLYPIWSYAGWAKGECPDELKGNSVMGIITPNGHHIIFNDEENSLNIQITNRDNNNPLTLITIKDSNITVECGEGTITQNAKKIVFQDGSIGIPKSDSVKDRLNIIERDINLLKNLFTQAPNLVISDPSAKAAFEMISKGWMEKLKETEVSDIHNENIVQP